MKAEYYDTQNYFGALEPIQHNRIEPGGDWFGVFRNRQVLLASSATKCRLRIKTCKEYVLT